MSSDDSSGAAVSPLGQITQGGAGVLQCFGHKVVHVDPERPPHHHLVGGGDRDQPPHRAVQARQTGGQSGLNAPGVNVRRLPFLLGVQLGLGPEQIFLEFCRRGVGGGHTDLAGADVGLGGGHRPLGLLESRAVLRRVRLGLGQGDFKLGKTLLHLGPVFGQRRQLHFQTGFQGPLGHQIVV